MNCELRRLKPSNAAELHLLISQNRKRLIRYFPLTVSKTKTEKDTHSFLESMELLRNEKMEYLMGNFIDGHLVGLFFVKTIDWRVPKCELAYFIDKRFEGKGLASIFMKKTLDFCFEQLNMHKIFLLIGAENTRSRKLAENAGFFLEGLQRQDYRTGEGELVDLANYALLNTNIK